MSFAQWIISRRKSLRLSQSECAELAGVSTPVWCEYENTEKDRQPRRSTVEKIARALDVDIDVAMKEAGYSPQLTPPEIPVEWARLWLSTPADRREKLMKATRGVQEAIATF